MQKSFATLTFAETFRKAPRGQPTQALISWRVKNRIENTHFGPGARRSMRRAAALQYYRYLAELTNQAKRKNSAGRLGFIHAHFIGRANRTYAEHNGYCIETARSHARYLRQCGLLVKISDRTGMWQLLFAGDRPFPKHKVESQPAHKTGVSPVRHTPKPSVSLNYFEVPRTIKRCARPTISPRIGTHVPSVLNPEVQNLHARSEQSAKVRRHDAGLPHIRDILAGLSGRKTGTGGMFAALSADARHNSPQLERPPAPS